MSIVVESFEIETLTAPFLKNEHRLKSTVAV